MDSDRRLACCQCRQRHLKCGGESPVCARCSADSIDCQYVASRRGQGPRRRRRAAQHKAGETRTAGSLTSATFSSVVPTPTSIQSPTASGRPADSVHLFELSDTHRSQLISLYYVHFHPAHPMLRPKVFATTREPRYLELLMCYIGTHYDSARNEVLGLSSSLTAALAGPDEQTLPRLALILGAIVSHSHHQPEEAHAYLMRSKCIADNLRLLDSAAGESSSATDEILRESFRRTWWELFCVESYFAVLHRRRSIVADDDRSPPLLPCADTLYEMGQCPTVGHSLASFEHRVFAHDAQDFSAHGYRIAASANLAKVLMVSTNRESAKAEVDAVDHAIVGWHFNLPEEHCAKTGYTPLTDEVMFQAHMFNRCAALLLHFPRSSLPMTVPTSAVSDCTQDCTALTPTSGVHTAKALLAAKEIANLIALPCALDNHSPLTICGIILSCMVHLAAVTEAHGHAAAAHDLVRRYRDSVILLLGALSVLGKKWSVAGRALSRLRLVANTLFPLCETTEHAEAMSVQDSGIELEQLPSDLSWFDLLAPGDFTFISQEGSGTTNQHGLFSPLPSLPTDWP